MLTPDQQKQKERAYKKVDRELVPDQLRDVLKDLAYWRAKLLYWENLERHTPATAPYWGTIGRKLKEITEIIATFEADAAQLNRRTR